MVSLLSCDELDGFFLLVVRAVFMSCCFGVLDCDPVFLTAFPPTDFALPPFLIAVLGVRSERDVFFTDCLWDEFASGFSLYPLAPLLTVELVQIVLGDPVVACIDFSGIVVEGGAVSLVLRWSICSLCTPSS